MEQPQDSLEEYERIAKISQYATVIGTILSLIINIWVMLSLMTDVLGLDMGQVIENIAKYGWRLPPDWVVKYQPYLYTMQWILLVTVMIDTGISFKYMEDGIPRVPLNYLRVVSFISFFCGMWLYLAYKVMAYGLMFFAGLVVMMYSVFAKSEDKVEEETEEFEPDIWKETASVFDPREFLS